MTADAAPRDPSEAHDALRTLFAGRPDALARVESTLERVSGTRLPVLIEGEPGTGRTLLAQVVHAMGPGRRAPRVEVDALGLGADAFARALVDAGEGTLVVEAVDALAPAAQAALHEAIRAGAARVVATTHNDLGRAVSAGWFLADLRDRLSVLRLRLPPLREHPDGAPALVLHALRTIARDAALEPTAATALRSLAWPGNAREAVLAARALSAWSDGGTVLRAHVARWAAFGALEPADGLATPSDAPRAVDERTLLEVERALLAERLERHEWRQAETADSLGIDRKTLYRKIRAFGLVRGRTPP